MIQMRMRFTKDERAAFVVGAEVEIRNGRFWYPAVVTGEIALMPGQCIWHVPCRVTDVQGRKGTVRVGDYWGAPPTGVRVRQS